MQGSRLGYYLLWSCASALWGNTPRVATYFRRIVGKPAKSAACPGLRGGVSVFDSYPNCRTMRRHVENPDIANFSNEFGWVSGATQNLGITSVSAASGASELARMVTGLLHV